MHLLIDKVLIFSESEIVLQTKPNYSWFGNATVPPQTAHYKQHLINSGHKIFKHQYLHTAETKQEADLESDGLE